MSRCGKYVCRDAPLRIFDENKNRVLFTTRRCFAKFDAEKCGYSPAHASQ